MSNFTKFFSFVCCLWVILSLSYFQQYSNADPLEIPAGLSLHNQLEYSYDYEKKQDIFENWFLLDYTHGMISAGLRYCAFLPNDPNPVISRGKQRFAEIDYKYFQFNLGNRRKGLKITVGNFYETFGKGLILKSYEDRNIRVDYNLQGIKLNGNYAKIQFKALIGSIANLDNQREDLIHAFDIEYRGIKKLKFGVSAAKNIPENQTISRETFYSLRIAPRIWNFDLYSELGIKTDSDANMKKLNDNSEISGQAFYGGTNFFLHSWVLRAEFKYYDHFNFSSRDGTVQYNTPPSLRNQYSYVLPNRHPSPLNQNNEQGFLFEINYNLKNDSYFSLLYSETNSLEPGSHFQKIYGLDLERSLLYKEFFANSLLRINEFLKANLAFVYTEEQGSHTKNIIPIFEIEYYFQEINTLRFSVEHQQTYFKTTEEKSLNDLFLIEFLRSPGYSIAYISEMSTREPTQNQITRKFWNSLNFNWQINYHSDINIMIGSRQQGNICVGGFCRYEPEFRGVEVKINTRVY